NESQQDSRFPSAWTGTPTKCGFPSKAHSPKSCAERQSRPLWFESQLDNRILPRVSFLCPNKKLSLRCGFRASVDGFRLLLVHFCQPKRLVISNPSSGRLRER